MKSLLKTSLLLGFVLMPFLALAAPGIPHQFYGTVKYTNGSDVNSGNVIVKIGATQVATIPISNGKYGDSSLLLVTDPSGNRAGSLLKFFIGSVDTGQTAVFVNGGPNGLPTELNLITATVVSDGGDGGGGGGGGGNNNTVTTATLTTAKKGDANNDGKVDKYDFALMMSDWGKTGTSNSDFNGDGKVDKYDFALLMSNWSL